MPTTAIDPQSNEPLLSFLAPHAAPALSGAQALLRCAGRLALPHVMIFTVAGRREPEVREVLLETAPPGWMDAYRTGGLLSRDPFLRQALSAPQPFAWSDLAETRAIAGPARTFTGMAAGYGLTEGFVVPLHHTTDIVTVIQAAGRGPGRLTLVDRSALVASALAGLNAVRRPPRQGERRLTRREAEVLSWIADGKSDWQVGQILRISAKTVNYHVENAKRKFAVATRVQAVVAALRTGELTPPRETEVRDTQLTTAGAA